MQALITA